MKHRNEDGYILASVLVMLLTISLVAAALVSTSADGLKDVRDAEADASAEATLRSAILLVSDQLALDPRRRQLDVDSPEASVNVLGRKVYIRAGWENAKLDVNLADPVEIEKALSGATASDDLRGRIRAAVQASRTDGKPITLLDSILPQTTDRDCLHSILTVFGGRREYRSEDGAAPTRIGKPAAGARVVVEVWLVEEADQPGIEAVLLMTGDPARPAEVLDWRRVRGGGKERCNV